MKAEILSQTILTQQDSNVDDALVTASIKQ
jgi:hypothetical protein